MDQRKTGKFIAQCRKDKGLTQRQLAEAIDVSDKTVSKWECGNGLPEVSLMLPLCEILEISVNELLCGERIQASDYKIKAEVTLMELIQEKQENKMKIILSGVVCAMMLVSVGTMALVTGLCEIETGWRIALIVIAVIEILVGIPVGCVLEKSAGYYECKHCKERFIPTMSAYVMGVHGITWRRLKCLHCGKVSNCRKKLTK
ncbi:MAG: helix-turn-helix domain-containing protein [Candidatus Coproplasma sp.]